MIKIAGIKSTAGISLSNKVVTVQSTAIADNKTVSVTGSGYKFKLNGNSAKNTLIGGNSDDTLTGNGGADLFVYTGGDDIITDYAEQDKISIKSGNYESEISGDDIILTTSNGTLTIKDATDKNITINNEKKNFSADSDESLPTGLSYNDDKTVLIVDNTFTIGDIDLHDYENVIDVDASSYRRMNLEITGNRFNNSLVGGTGADILAGDEGNDILTGGAGSDLFVHYTGDDVITDYTAGTDKIQLDNTKIIKYNVGDNDVVFTTSTGSITVLNGAGKRITIDDVPKIYSANLSDIIADNSVGEFEFENKISPQENLITYSK